MFLKDPKLASISRLKSPARWVFLPLIALALLVDSFSYTPNNQAGEKAFLVQKTPAAFHGVYLSDSEEEIRLASGHLTATETKCFDFFQSGTLAQSIFVSNQSIQRFGKPLYLLHCVFRI